MKKLSKNLAMYIMCFSMFMAVFCAMSIKAEAANVTSGTLGDNNGISWTYDADTKILTITGEDGGMEGKYDKSTNKTRSLFWDICKDVEVIKVQNCTFIGEASSAFAYLDSLKKIEFENFDTSQITSMRDMFHKCSGLTELDLSGFNTSNVVTMFGMFRNCSNLSSLDLSSFNTSNVTDMGYMFFSCSNLSNLKLSNFNTSNVRDMNRMFAGCKKLSSLDLSGFNTSNVTDMSFLFADCDKLSSLNMSNFNMSNVTDIRYMLYGCSKLAVINTPKIIPETLSVDLPSTYVALEGNQTKMLTKDFCKTTLVEINHLVTAVNLDASYLEVLVGKSVQLNATVLPEKAAIKAVTWKSSNTAVATVDSNGKVTAVAPGTATITATAKDGSGKSASCTVKVMTEQERQVRTFVERMYTIVLGRAAEAQGLNDWTARLMAKEIDGATLVDMFVNSDEFIARNTSDEDYIKILYCAILGREADAEGLKMWKNMLADDWTRDYIMEGLVLSTEFKSICDSYGIIAAFEPTAESQVRSFVKRMYTVVLGRRADAVGLEEWTQRLLSGTANGAQLADGFISSDEFVNRNLSDEKYVKVLYRAFFSREADEGGFNVWMGELAKGVSRRDVMKGFVHSVEFSDLCAQYGIIRGEIQ